ncbi:NAD-dependent epimerase [Alphaproteobacteria bacterium]|nr:NAD-dependent epimerase [Alphaproteobacteria bacterium]
MKILVTGSAGFIGSELCVKLLKRGESVIGIDNHNDYYDPKLKEARLSRHINHSNYTHLHLDISDKEALEAAFEDYEPEHVVNLAAQAGVRFSIENPHTYVQSNIVGFINVLECCRHYGIEHLVYASSSSVYGANTAVPFSVHDNVDHPLSLYAASKKSNELMAHSYSHLYGLPTTGLRFFTVYGPWGRPDMAPFKFAKAIVEGKPIKVYNFGKHSRDFTYIDDIVEILIRSLDCVATSNPNWEPKRPDPATSFAPYRLYNVGGNNPVDLMDFINFLEKALAKQTKKVFLPMQPGDVISTSANIEDLVENFDFEPKTNIIDGINLFADWFLRFHESRGDTSSL